MSFDPPFNKRIILLQKRIIRILNKEKVDAHTDPIFSELKILKFDKIYLYVLKIYFLVWIKFINMVHVFHIYIAYSVVEQLLENFQLLFMKRRGFLILSLMKFVMRQHRYRRYRSPTRLRRRDILKIQDGGRKRAKSSSDLSNLGK